MESTSEQPISEEITAVFVSNLSPSAEQKVVIDFFSYCGKVKQVILRNKQGEDSQEAIIFFETPAAARTALLLSNALVADRAIVVSPYNGKPPVEPDSEHKEEKQVTLEKQDISQKEFEVPDAQRSKTSVVSSLIVAGYKLGSDVIRAAKEYDEKHQLTSQLSALGEAAILKATEFDSQYLKLGDKWNQLGSAWQNVDEQYKIKDRVQSGVQAVGDAVLLGAGTAKSLAQQAAENPYVSQGVSTMKSYGDSIAKVVEDEKAAVSAGIQAQRREEEQKSCCEKSEKSCSDSCSENSEKSCSESCSDQSGKTSCESQK